LNDQIKPKYNDNECNDVIIIDNEKKYVTKNYISFLLKSFLRNNMFNFLFFYSCPSPGLKDNRIDLKNTKDINCIEDNENNSFYTEESTNDSCYIDDSREVQISNKNFNENTVICIDDNTVSCSNNGINIRRSTRILNKQKNSVRLKYNFVYFIFKLNLMYNYVVSDF
jgi:hypothetical protein